MRGRRISQWSHRRHHVCCIDWICPSAFLSFLAFPLLACFVRPSGCREAVTTISRTNSHALCMVDGLKPTWIPASICGLGLRGNVLARVSSLHRFRGEALPSILPRMVPTRAWYISSFVLFLSLPFWGRFDVPWCVCFSCPCPCVSHSLWWWGMIWVVGSRANPPRRLCVLPLVQSVSVGFPSLLHALSPFYPRPVA